MAFMDFLPQFGDNTDQTTDDATLAQINLKRKLALADSLRNTPSLEGQMVSGHYVRPSWTQSLANAVNKGFGMYTEKQAIKEYADYQKSQQDKMANALKTLGSAFEPKLVTNTEIQNKEVPLTQGMNVPVSPSYSQTSQANEQVSQIYPNFDNKTPVQNMSGSITQATPITTTSFVQPTLNDIEKAFGQYATDIKNPKLLETLLSNRYEKMVKANEPIKLGKDEAYYTSNGTLLFKNPGAGEKYKNIQQDKAGNSFGFNTETNQWEQIPGAKMATEQWSAPYQVGNQFLQRNTSTGEIRNAYDSGDKQKFSQTTELRNDFNNLPQVKAWNVIEPVLLSAREAAKDTSGASDLNLIYALGKVLDPNSVVREGELQLAAGTGSLGDRLKGYYKSAINGGKLPPEVKQDLLNQIESRTFSQRKQYEAAKTKYTEIAKKNQIDPNDLFISTVVEPVNNAKPVINADIEKQQAIEWINANPTDPRVPQIKQRLGIK